LEKCDKNINIGFGWLTAACMFATIMFFFVCLFLLLTVNVWWRFVYLFCRMTMVLVYTLSCIMVSKLKLTTLTLLPKQQHHPGKIMRRPVSHLTQTSLIASSSSS